jgi:transcriptional regulator with PAS, ATPase and Fis domain
LDEIGEVPPPLQLRLLRVLQEREVTRVGDVRARKINVRVVAATNRDLRMLVKEGAFREDLFYRLHVFPIHVPALRERASDIPLLVTTRLSAPNAISPLAMRLLREYSWPGNVRELFAAVESASIRAGGDGARIDAQHLPEEVRTAGSDEGENKARYRAVDDAAEEREAIRAALELTDGAVTRAAELLGMGRTTLWRKMRALGLSS